MPFFTFSMTMPERGQHGPSARHISLAFARVDGQRKDHPHALCCSVAYRMHVYIVDRLFGSVLMNGSGSKADVPYAEVMLCILLICPLQPERGRIICKHSKKVYNKYV